MYSFVKEAINFSMDRVLQKFGLYLVRVADIKTVVGSQFIVNMEDCLNGYGFSFDPNGNHPQMRFLMEYNHDNYITYELSSLKAFMDTFSPRTLDDFVQDFSHQSQLEIYVPFLDITKPHLPMPWSTLGEINRYRTGLRDHLRSKGSSKGVPYQESIIDEEGKKDFTRLKETYDSINTSGYNPEAASDGSLQNRFIQVVILRNGNQQKYIVMSGHHRMAALSALGWTKVPVILVANGMPIVDIANVDNWPVVREGLYDVATGKRVFEHFFSNAMSVRS